jgi:hypothetical protein
MNMSILSDRLDKVASSLESKGLLKEAEAIDIISNTLEAFEKEAWTAQKSPIYMKFLSPAMNAAQAGSADVALKALKMGDGMRKALIESRDNIPEFKFFSGLWLQAVSALEKGNTAQAASDLEQAYSFLLKIEPLINAEAPGYKPQNPKQDDSGERGQPGQPGKPNNSDMFFTSKKIQPGAFSKKPPVLPPARAMRSQMQGMR